MSAESSILVDNLLPSHGLTDPHVWIEDGRVYMFGGHDESWMTDDRWVMDRWEIWSSENLRDWRYENKILPMQTYIGAQPNCFAGDIAEREGQYYWYFSNRSISTGVMVSDRITGDFVDALGKPLVEKSMLTKGHAYDPEIFVEDGKYYMIVGTGVYHIAELNEDMISFANELQPIQIVDADGKSVWADDKSAMFMRNDLYYLVWGGHYATSDSLYGPYLYRGAFLEGGHNSIFEFNNRWYVLQENKDISLFYRGITLKSLTFDQDGLVVIPDDDMDYPGEGRYYDFSRDEAGWQSISDATLSWNKRRKSIGGKIKGETSVQSAVWLVRETKDFSEIRVTLTNHSDALQARVYLSTFTPSPSFWETPQINWADEMCYTIDLKPSSEGAVTYMIAVDASDLQHSLKAIRVDPAVGVSQGRWEMNGLVVE